VKYAFTIPGPPQAKQRPRFGNGRTYTADATAIYENWVKLQALNARVKPLEGPVKLTLVWAKQIPASWSKKRKAAALAQVYATGTPDLDNVAKSIGDALNHVAYADDGQVASLTISRVYVESESYVRVEIETLEGGAQ
jgi:Holliday junction resolvase RusA-like endonuclease